MASLLAAFMMLTGCDHIAEDERLIYEPIEQETPPDTNPDDDKPELPRRVVLLEDFTGQRCTNCPTATIVIEQLQEAYGDALVAVGIHGGPLAFAGTAKVPGLKTETGDTYYSHWNLEYQPVGLVDRHGAVNYPDWAAEVRRETAKPAPLWLEGSATADNGTVTITVSARGADATVTGKLQAWLIEDGITALQLMPDGSANQQYTHNHVFRTAVNGIWGENITVRNAETEQRTLTLPLQPEWKAENLSVVCFVYNDDGVQQAAKFKVETPSPL